MRSIRVPLELTVRLMDDAKIVDMLWTIWDWRALNYIYRAYLLRCPLFPQFFRKFFCLQQYRVHLAFNIFC
jgi:hypothetical protein